MSVAATSPTAPCPHCGQAARGVHSQYDRTLADLPVQGLTLRFRVRLRRFYCRQPACARSVFCERLGSFAAPHARQTRRLQDCLLVLAQALGGNAGARLAERLSLPASATALLRRARQAPLPSPRTPRVLGVDDWAWRKDHTYGTILVDLERHRVVDLLPDRSAESLATWLKAHPGVEIVSRDRASMYADGVRQGAPEAIQVADRWHLLKNLGEALTGVLERHAPAVREAARAASPPSPPTATVPPAPPGPSPAPRITRQQELMRESRDRRRARYEEVIALHARGLSISAIAVQTGRDRKTIRKWVEAGAFPEPTPRRTAPSRLQPYVAHLARRWDEGCHNAARLWREIREQGFPGQVGAVRLWLSRWRPRTRVAGTATAAKGTAAGVPGSPRSATWVLLKAEDQRSAAQRTFVDTLCAKSPEVRQAVDLARRFLGLVRERREADLEAWMQDAASSPMRHFAAGLRRDWDAVCAALRLPWSNGQVEGQVHRLKLIKRQGYGRARFPLLRSRLLAPTRKEAVAAAA